MPSLTSYTVPPIPEPAYAVSSQVIAFACPAFLCALFGGVVPNFLFHSATSVVKKTFFCFVLFVVFFFFFLLLFFDVVDHFIAK